MAVVHRIKGSDGQIHRVQAAENADPSDLILLVEQQIIRNQPIQQRAPAPAPVERSNLRELADIPLKATEGAVAGVRMISDVFGANNVVSKNLRSVEDYLSALNSAQSKADSQQIAAIMKDAEDKGLGEQVRAGLKAFSVAPVDFLASAAGTAVPTILGGLGAGALKAGAMGARATQLGLGAATGAGVTKGAIYEGVKEALANTNMPADQVEARAQLAQSYNGENLDQILFGTALGGLAATTGIEPKFVPGVSNAIRSRAKEALVTGTKEAIPEALQGSQEQLAQNLALQREGFDVPTMRGVVGQGTLEGVAGAGLGGGLGAYTQSRQNSAIQAQEDAEAKQRQAALTGINAERARQSGLVDEARQTAQQTQFATDERTADLAGKAQVDAQISAEAAEYQAKQAKVKEGQALVQEGMKEVPDLFAKTDSAAGIQDLLSNFDDYFYFPKKEDGAALRKQLQQQLNTTKQAETARKKLSDTDIEYTALADVQDTFQKQFGVTSEAQLDSVPLTQLTTAMSQLRTEQPSQKDKFVMKKFDLAEQKLQAAIDNHPETLEKLSLAQANKDEVADLRRRSQLIKAREKELALFDNDPLKRDAFKKVPGAMEAYTAQQKAQVQIPDEAFPVYDEASYEEKMAQLERARNEQEIEAFALEEQFPSPRTPSDAEAVNEVIQQVPAEQRDLFNQFDQPTAAAMRGTADTKGVSQTQLERASESDAVPSLPETADVSEAEAVEAGTLGDAGRTTRATDRGTVPSDTGQPSALSERKQVLAELGKLLKDKQISVQEYRGYADTAINEGARAADDLASVVLGEVGYVSPLKTKPVGAIEQKRRQAAKELAPEVAEAEQNIDLVEDEIIGYDDLTNEPYDANDQFFESRKAKPKKDSAPKDISGKLREESTEPTTPELFAEKVSNWFNPVWYKNAIKNGMVNIVDGNINDTDLSDAVKEKYADAKALFTPDGKSYFFIANITKGNELGVFLHEIGEHKGLDNLIGKDRVKQLANRVRQMAEGKGSAREVAMAKQAIEMAEGQAQNDKEIIAYFGEIAVFNGVRPGAKARPEFGKATGWVTELWNSITSAVKKLNLNPDKVSDKDIVDMLYGAARLELGAVQTFEEQVGQPVPNEPEILASFARNPALQLTPEEEADRRARGLTVRPPPQRQTMKEKMQDSMGMNKGRDEFFDRMGNAIVGPLFTIHRKATKYYGPDGFYTKSTGKLLGSLMAQHSLNANNYTFEFIKEGSAEIEKQGFIKSVKSEANIVNLNKDYVAIMDALQADGSNEAVAYQQIANMILADRYESLKIIGAKSSDEFTKEDAAEGMRLRTQHKALYDTWRNRYNDMRKNKIDFLVESGTYTRKQAETLMNRLEYVPLYRIKDSEGADGAFMQGLLSSKQQQKLQFDTKNYDVADIMTNIALNEMWLYKKGIFNHTTNLLIDQVEEMGGGRHVKIKNPDDEQTIAYLRNGEVQYFKFDDPNDMAILRAVPVINNWAVSQMRFLGGLLRKGITLTPSFIYRQVWQDVERGWMQSGTNQPFHKMLGQSISEQAKNAKKDSETRLARELRSRGVVGAVEYQDSFENAVDELFGRDKESKSLFEKAYKKLEYMEKLAQNSDMAARAIVYQAALDEGASEGEAALRAQMMLNYQHRGTSPSVRALLSTIPFMNTKLQSEWRLVEAIQGKIPGLSKEKARKLLAMKVLKFATLAAAYAMVRSGDDDYEKASDEQRNRNFLINAGGVPLRIPVAPEYMLVKAGMEQATRLAIDAEFASDRKLGHAVASSIGGLLLGADEVTPAILRPLLENMTNYSFFNDRALVGQGLLTRDVNLRYVEGQTSELAKFISNSMQSVGGNIVNVSPIKIDNFINGIFGTMGRDVLFTTNLLAESISGVDRPELRIDQYAEVGTAFYNTEGNQREADYYQVRDKVETAYASYRSLVKTDPDRAREYLAENKQLINQRGAVEAVGTKLEQLRARQNKVLASKTLTDTQKRAEISKIRELKDRAVTAPTKRIRERIE